MCDIELLLGRDLMRYGKGVLGKKETASCPDRLLAEVRWVDYAERAVQQDVGYGAKLMLSLQRCMS